MCSSAEKATRDKVERFKSNREPDAIKESAVETTVDELVELVTEMGCDESVDIEDESDRTFDVSVACEVNETCK